MSKKTPSVVYVFVYEVVPTKGSKEHGVVGRASADIWVLSSNREEAEIKAKAYIIDLLWNILYLERELVISDDDIHRYKPLARESYKHAKNHGVYGSFVGSPPEDREDDVVEIWTLDVPVVNKTKH